MLRTARELRGCPEQLGTSRGVGCAGDLCSGAREAGCLLFVLLILPGFAAFWSTERWCGGGLVMSAGVCGLRESKPKQSHV